MNDGESDTGILRRKFVDDRLKTLGHNQKGVVDLYDKWGPEGYDEDSETADRPGLFVFANTIAQVCTGDRDSAKILDVAAGTGLLAEQLQKEGFKLIDALDPSSGMLKAARRKKVYQNYICAFMEEVGDSIEKDHYDIVCCLGGIAAGHLKAEALAQMYDKTKPGGILCICGKKIPWDSDPEYSVRMRNAITQMTDAGKVAVERDTVIKEYFRREHSDWQEGVMILMRKL